MWAEIDDIKLRQGVSAAERILNVPSLMVD